MATLAEIEQAERCYRRARLEHARGDAVGCQDALAEGLALVRASGLAVEAGLLVVAAQLTAWSGDPDATLRAAQTAAAVAGSANAFLAGAEYALAQALYLANSAACLDHFAAAKAYAAKEGDVDMEFEAWLAQAALLAIFGSSRESLVQCESLRRAAAAAGRSIWEHQAAWAIARTRWLASGDAEQAIPVFRRLLKQRGIGLHRPQLLAELAQAMADSGDTQGAWTVLGASEAAANTGWTDAAAAYYRAEIEWASGRPARVLEATEGALELDLPPLVEAGVRETRLWALYELDRPAGDPLLVIRQTFFAGANRENAAFAALVVGDLGLAESELREAAAAWRENITRNELRALWGAAQIAVRCGEPDRGRKDLLELEKRASAIGLASVLARVRASLRMLGEIRPAKPRSSSPSRREVEILRLVARGSSTRLIAKELAVSQRTIETHIRSVMTKLGAATRIQAVIIAGFAADTGAVAALPAPVASLLDSLAEGNTITAAAARLGIPRRTATRLLETARRQLSVETNTEAVTLYRGSTTA